MDRTQFAARIDELLGSKVLAQQLGARGRQLLRDKFNFDQYISGLEEMFSRVINSTGERETAAIENGHARA
jgi:hypothetical protein